MQKYEFTGETRKTHSGVLLHRIRALRDFGCAVAGDLGGWIQQEANLSQEGNAWVADDAMVYGQALVCDDGIVANHAMVFGSALISGNAAIYDNVLVYGDAVVTGYANAFGEAVVCDNAYVMDSAILGDNALVCGDAIVSGDAFLWKDAVVSNPKQYLCVGPIGRNNDTITFYRTFSYSRDSSGAEGIGVKYGSFDGPLETFVNAVFADREDRAFQMEYITAAFLAWERLRSA